MTFKRNFIRFFSLYTILSAIFIFLNGKVNETKIQFGFSYLLGMLAIALVAGLGSAYVMKKK